VSQGSEQVEREVGLPHAGRRKSAVGRSGPPSPSRAITQRLPLSLVLLLAPLRRWPHPHLASVARSIARPVPCARPPALPVRPALILISCRASRSNVDSTTDSSPRAPRRCTAACPVRRRQPMPGLLAPRGLERSARSRGVRLRRARASSQERCVPRPCLYPLPDYSHCATRARKELTRCPRPPRPPRESTCRPYVRPVSRSPQALSRQRSPPTATHPPRPRPPSSRLLPLRRSRPKSAPPPPRRRRARSAGGAAGPRCRRVSPVSPVRPPLSRTLDDV